MGKATMNATSDCPEFVVGIEVLNSFFDPPLPKSTFYDLVNKGKITPFKWAKGRYLLNDTLRRLGMREVRKLPKEPVARSLEDVTRLAFTMIDSLLFPPPAWLLSEETVDFKDIDHAQRLADQYRSKVEAFENAYLRLAYFGGVLDALAVEAADSNWG